MTLKLRVQPGACFPRIAIRIVLTVMLIGCYAGIAAAQWTTTGNNINNTNTGNVGIGTTNPQNPLTIARSNSAPWTGRPAYELLQLIDRTDNTPQIMFGSENNGMFLRYTGPFTAANQRLGIITGGSVEAFVVRNDGNVGIGTTNPVAKLDVNGNISVTGTGNITAAGTIEAGNIKAKYQDVAEWVPSTHTLPAGTVVTLDPTKSNHVEASSKAYDTRVAGVVSLQPGIALGEEGQGKVLVATTGRVRIKVDASRGPIEVGDLLVTGSVPGVAMKSQPVTVAGVEMHRPGTLIGKALEPLAKGQGEILILLSLQ